MAKVTAAVVRRHRQLWRQANFRLVPLAILAVIGVVITEASGQINLHHVDHRVVASIGVIIFVLSAVTFLHVSTATMRKVLAHYLGPSRAANTQFVAVVAGYIVIILITLGLLHISVTRLLLGGAVTGIILGVAAQQSLANFFASIIILLVRPYSVGEHVLLRSGGLGGEYDGIIADIGMTHTRIRLEDGTYALLPNAAILSGAAILPVKDPPKSPAV